MSSVAVPAATLADRLRGQADQLGQRLVSPDTVRRIAAEPSNVDPVFGAALWMPSTLSHGYPGIATFLGELAREDPRWRPAAHAHLNLGVASLAGSPANGLFAGPAAVLAAAQTCSADGDYRVLRQRLLTWLTGDQLGRITLWRDRRSEGFAGVGWSAYDTVNGLSGTGQLLLDALAEPDVAGGIEVGKLEDCVLSTVRFLTELTEPITVDGHRVPGWWIPSELQPSDLDRHEYPHGDFNLGLAHGIPAALAFLARAQQAGFDAQAAIHRIVAWLIRWQGHDEAGSYWPARVGWSDQTGATVPSMEFTRSAWCYGAPGVAVALFEAGIALAEPAWWDIALDALHSTMRRDRGRWRLEGATLCHGYAGLMTIMLRVGATAEDLALIEAATDLSGTVLELCDPDMPFGVSHLVPDSVAGWRRTSTLRPLDVAGLLEGSAGVGCALLDLARYLDGTGVDRPASWARAMMLA